MNDCTCLYDSNDGDQPEFSTQEWRTARKPHKCCECRLMIPAGTKYEAFSGKWENGMETYHTCVACQDIRSSLSCDGGWTFGQLWENVEEQIFNEGGLTIACIDKCATVGGKTKLQQAFMAYIARNDSSRT